MIIKVEVEGKVYEVKILEVNDGDVLTDVGGKAYAVKTSSAAASSAPVASPAETAVAAPADLPSAAVSADASTLNAPLPGTIVEIKVKPGQTVKNGDVLMILEAMKMKNTIRSTRDGVVLELLVNPKDQVKHNQPLLRYGD